MANISDAFNWAVFLDSSSTNQLGGTPPPADQAPAGAARGHGPSLQEAPPLSSPCLAEQQYFQTRHFFLSE